MSLRLHQRIVFHIQRCAYLTTTTTPRHQTRSLSARTILGGRYAEFDREAYQTKRQDFDAKRERERQQQSSSSTAAAATTLTPQQPSQAYHRLLQQQEENPQPCLYRRVDDEKHYKRDKDNNYNNNDEPLVIDTVRVERLINARVAARRARDFGTADTIRDELMQQHGVSVSDANHTYRAGYSVALQKRRQRRRLPVRMLQAQLGPLGHDYQLAPDAGPNYSGWPEAEIHARLSQRLTARIQHDYAQADEIQAELSAVGIYTNDDAKLWRADGRTFPRNGGTMALRENYTQASDSPETPYQAEIQHLVNRRNQAKLTREFDAADKIKETLRVRYNVHINDKIRVWSVGRLAWKK